MTIWWSARLPQAAAGQADGRSQVGVAVPRNAEAVRPPVESTLGSVARIRVGTHEGYTRIVFDLGGPYEWSLDQPAAGPVRVVIPGIGLDDGVRRLDFPRGVVRSIQPIRRSGGVEILVFCEPSQARVRTLTLTDPHRLVVDVMRPGAGEGEQAVAQQALRANRTCPPEGGALGWTYIHQPYLAYWRDRFYLQYLSTPREEHVPPGRTLLMTSTDGQHWSNPRVIFPEYALPEVKTADGGLPAGTPAIMHQRMGFYTAPNGRLLTLGFYSFCVDPLPQKGTNRGQGLGRVVREIHRDNTFGPIFFIRHNRHAGWNGTNTSYPFYKTSSDAGLVEACDALLADKLMTLQWWEEDRATDGFYTIQPDKAEPKALSFVHRPDGVVLGVWKAH